MRLERSFVRRDANALLHVAAGAGPQGIRRLDERSPRRQNQESARGLLGGSMPAASQPLHPELRKLGKWVVSCTKKRCEKPNWSANLSFKICIFLQNGHRFNENARKRGHNCPIPIRTLCQAFLCFHIHSGFERNIYIFLLLVCRSRVTAGLTPASGVDPSEESEAFISFAWTFGKSGWPSRDIGRFLSRRKDIPRLRSVSPDAQLPLVS